MRTWVYSPHTGGKSIPPAIRERTEQRIVAYAAKHHAGKFTRIGVRFHGALCYIDAYTEPGEPPEDTSPAGETREQWIERLSNTPTHLCRIRYFGNEDRWSFAWYTYAHEKYEPGFLISGADHGTPEEAFETSAMFL
ncbi:conserved hypothetical protein [Candidatus Sulfopaludibacter sp. SbA3]|nr:conserved hypothetical protein [Candidatus Sulfopaludibacter sp. SbA3]